MPPKRYKIDENIPPFACFVWGVLNVFFLYFHLKSRFS